MGKYPLICESCNSILLLYVREPFKHPDIWEWRCQQCYRVYKDANNKVDLNSKKLAIPKKRYDKPKYNYKSHYKHTKSEAKTAKKIRDYECIKCGYINNLPISAYKPGKTNPVCKKCGGILRKKK